MTATTASASPRPDTAIRHRAVFFVLGAAVLFAVCNVAWRYGGGSTLAVVALRAGLGALVGWAITRRAGRPRWTSALRSRSGRVAVVVAGLDLLAAGAMFRALDGTLAGLALAYTPAVALLVRDRAGRLATVAALGSPSSPRWRGSIACATKGLPADRAVTRRVAQSLRNGWSG